MDKNEKLIRYSMQLGMLRTLLNANELTEKEYNTVRMSLMRDYNMYPHTLWD
ncbi:MAG: conjugal transfer protein [Clostridia bacterium]|nr:conjugal transfer protein [Clostridia bacterium]